MNYPYTELSCENLIKKRYKAILEELKVFLAKLYNGKLVFNFGNNTVNSVPADLVRALSEWSQDDFIDLTIRNIIVDAIVSSENKQVGSGVICAVALLTDNDFDSNVRHLRSRSMLQDLDKTIKYNLGNGNLSEVTKKSINMGSLNGSLRFDVSCNKDFLIQSDSAIKIKGNVHPMFNMGTRWIESATVVCVDGLIESLGEIDSILQESSKHKSNVIILASDYHPDVINTLDINFKDKRLNVIPFVVRSWSDDPERSALKVCDDMQIECVSRDRGDVLASKGLGDFSVIKTAYISAGDIAIHSDVGNEIHTTIKIPNTLDSLKGLIEDRIRITLQSCKGVSKWGLVKNHDILGATNMLGISHPYVSVNSLYFGILTAKNCKSSILNTGAFITPDIK